jgi:hypothetical protein
MNYQHEPTSPVGVPTSPVGYISCGGYQYAIVPVPMNQYEMDAASSPMHQHHQEPMLHHHQANQHYHHMDQQCWDPTPYQCMQDFPPSPVAVGTVMGGSQWW